MKQHINFLQFQVHSFWASLPPLTGLNDGAGLGTVRCCGAQSWRLNHGFYGFQIWRCCLVCVEKWWNDDDIDMTLWPDLWRIRCTSQGFPEVCGFSRFSPWSPAGFGCCTACSSSQRSVQWQGRLDLSCYSSLETGCWWQNPKGGSILIYKMTGDGGDHAWSSSTILGCFAEWWSFDMFVTKPKSRCHAHDMVTLECRFVKSGTRRRFSRDPGWPWCCGTFQQLGIARAAPCSLAHIAACRQAGLTC